MSDHTAPHPAVDSFLDEYVMEQTRIRAAELTDKSQLPPDQCEDIQQEMVIRLINAYKRFDPAKASMHTFASRVLDCFCMDFIRRQASKKRRGNFEVASTDISNDFSLDLYAVGDSVLDELDREEIGLRVRSVIESLDDDLKSLCEAMLQINDRKVIAETLGIARSSVYRRIARIQAHFRAAGLEPEGSSGTHSDKSRK